MEKVGFKSKLGATAISEAMSNSENPDVQNRIFIGGISQELGEEQLTLIFKPFGSIKSLTLTRDPVTQESKGFGYVVFENPEVIPHVCEKLNGIKIRDQSLVVRPATVKKAPTVVMNGDEAVELDPTLVAQSKFDLPDLKTPFIAESNKAREAAKMLLKQAGLSTGGQIQRSPPSRILILRNMVTREDLEVCNGGGGLNCRTLKTIWISRATLNRNVPV